MSAKIVHKIIVSGVLLTAAVAAQAQVEEITVSAQRREANLQEVPISVSAFTFEDTARLQIDVTKDIAAAVPNMQTYAVTANETAMQVFMRGAGVQNPGFIQSESPVGIYVDDIYRGRLASANLDLTDIERIEVLRGPQGTLYGRNTIGGAIKFVTRTPADDLWADASIGYGNFDTTKINASVGGPLIAEKLGGSISGLYTKRGEGWIERGSVGGRELGEFENKILRGKLNWFAGDIFSATLTAGYVDVENDGYNGIPYGPDFSSSPGEPREGFYDTLVPDETAGFGKSEQKNASLNLAWDLDSVTLRSITGFGDIDDVFRFDINAGFNNFGGPGAPGLYVTSESSNKTVTQEFNISGTGFNDKLDYIAGVFYMSEDGDQVYEPLVNIAPPGDPFFFVPAFTENSDAETKSYAVFAEGTWHYTDKFSATLGLRWTEDQKKNSIACVGGSCVDENGVNQAWQSDLEKDFSETTPRLLLQYQATETIMIFGGVSSGFQSGGFQTLCFGNQSCANSIYDPQTVLSWEAGVKSDLIDRTLRINFSAFLAQYEDLQQSTIFPTPGGPSFPTLNVGKVDVPGLELEVNWVPIENFTAFLIAGYAKEDFDSETKQTLGVDRLPGLPRQTARVGADWRTNIAGSWDFLIGADVNYVDSYFATINNVLEIDSFARVNGRIGFEQPDGNWSVILRGKNLGDSEDNVSGIVDGFNGINIRTVQPPREYMLEVGFRY